MVNFIVIYATFEWVYNLTSGIQTLLLPHAYEVSTTNPYSSLYDHTSVTSAQNVLKSTHF
jgi:hypothetical protein